MTTLIGVVAGLLTEPRTGCSALRELLEMLRTRKASDLSFTAMLLIVLVLSPTVLAHDGPEDVIRSLTATMLRSGPSADLLFRRACEFRAMRDYERAAIDLRHAVAMDSSMDIARLELARLQLLLEQTASKSGHAASTFGEPLETLKPLFNSSDPSVRTASLALRGEIQLAYGHWSAAIDDFSTALAHRSDVQWYLWRAEAQHHSGQHNAGLAGLRKADSETRSPVIRTALCDALIGAVREADISGKRTVELIREATDIIQQELNASRLKSAWQIRHAELLLLGDDRPSAEVQLRAAIAELDERLATSRPDPALVQDREKAVQLLR